MEERETEEEVRDECGDAQGEEWACWTISSTISTFTMSCRDCRGRAGALFTPVALLCL